MPLPIRSVVRCADASRLRLLVIAAVATLCFSRFSRAATFTAVLDRDTITLGERATLSLTFSGATPQSPPSVPEVPGLQIDYLGQSSHVNIVQQQISSSVSHNFSITPQRAGDFVIPSLAVDAGGEKLTTQPLKLRVLKPEAPPPGAIESGSQLAFLRLQLPKKELYLGETVTVQLELFLHSNVRRYQFQPTAFPADGCNVGKMVQLDQRRSQVGSAVYTVIPQLYSLKAIKTGSLTLGPVTGNVFMELNSGRRRSDPFFEQFGFRDLLGGGEQKQLVLASEPVSLQCHALPKENVPTGFSGAVGSFTMNVSAGPTNVAVGDPITVHVKLAGHGDFDSLALPEQPAWHDFKTYPPTTKVDTSGDPLGLQGSKTFEQVIIPQNADVKEVPPLTFSFFDPDQKGYRSLTQPAVKLVVRPGGSAPPPTVATASRTAQPEPPAQDIVPIKTRMGPLGQIASPLIQQPWFVVLQSVPVVAWLSALILRRRAEALANNPRLRRQRQVANLIRSGLLELRRQAAENKAEEFFAGLFRLLQEQLGERLDLPASSITEAVIAEQLRPRGVPDAILNPLQELFHACNLARYAKARSSEELAALCSKLESTLKELQSLKL
jgi:hypothetical protein